MSNRMVPADTHALARILIDGPIPVTLHGEWAGRSLSIEHDVHIKAAVDVAPNTLAYH